MYGQLSKTLHTHRRCLPAYDAGKICTVVILGLATAESLQLRWGKPIHKPKINFTTPQLYISDLLSRRLRVICLSPRLYNTTPG